MAGKAYTALVTKRAARAAHPSAHWQEAYAWWRRSNAPT